MNHLHQSQLLINFLINTFTSSDENLWGIKNNNCKQVSFETKNSYIGRDHLHVKWDASQCNYIGIGLKWDYLKNLNQL